MQYVIKKKSLYFTECPDGSFGVNCKFSCNCKDDEVCDKTEGTCSSGCKDGFWGPHCQNGELRDFYIVDTCLCRYPLFFIYIISQSKKIYSSEQ